MSPAVSRIYSTREAARLTGVSVRRIVWWSVKGLLNPEGGARGFVFRESDLRVIRIIRALRAKRCSLETIWRMLPSLEYGAAGYIAIFGEPRRLAYCRDKRMLMDLGVELPSSIEVVEIPGGAR